MKSVPMPISSPSRAAESFPPPLMRFLRSNIGSTSSRGRSRSSPLFYIRSCKRAEIIQEPSSPKVTCIGQVRSTKSGAAAANHHRLLRRRRFVIKNPLFCGSFSSRFYSQKRAFRRFFSKWFLFLRAGYCKKVDTEEDPFRVHCKQKGEKTENPACYCGSSYENFEDKIQESESDFVDYCSPPPRNGLMLKRCRSAPYRSSSFGGKFQSSPSPENGEKSMESQKSSYENEEKNSRIGNKNNEKLENSENNDEDNLKGIVSFPVHPLLLTRCKSEPARRGERLNPESSFRRQRRL